eukprot:6009984-Amphidinium_carterae.1
MDCPAQRHSLAQSKTDPTGIASWLHYKSRKTPGEPKTFKGGKPKKDDKEQPQKQERGKTDEDEEWEEAS